MPKLSTCPCCPLVEPPKGFDEEPILGLQESELLFNEQKHLQLSQPAVIKKLDTDLNYDSEFVKKNLASDYGCSSAFRVLSDEGLRIVQKIIHSTEKYAISTPRIPRVIRYNAFRSKFLNGLGHSPRILRMVSELAGCEMIYHPMKIQSLHTNLKPFDEEGNPNKKNIDKWHCDITSFVLILFCTDPSTYVGGELQYFNGTKEEGLELLTSNSRKLPEDRLISVGEQFAGHGVFMQGSRVFHQVTPVISGDERTTMVFSFQPKNVLALEPTNRLNVLYNRTDPLEILLPDWVRFRAWRVMSRFDIWRKENNFDDNFNLIQMDENESAELEDGNKNYLKDLGNVLKNANNKLRDIVETLPYTSDRHVLTDLVEKAANEFRPFLLKKCENEEKNGLPNIRAGLEELDNCIEDVLILKDKQSDMVFF